MYDALNNDLTVLATIGMRTIFECASELLGVVEFTFDAKLDKLKELGKLGSNEREMLNVLTEAGNAAVHRGWKPNSEQLETMANIVEAFLHRNFVLEEAAKLLKAKIPPRSNHNRLANLSGSPGGKSTK